MKRLTRERLFGALLLEGPAPVDSVLAELRAVPRALPLRDDDLLRRGRGPRFVLTRWKFQDTDTLLVRLDVAVTGDLSGSRAEVRASPSRMRASLLLLPLLPLVALFLPVIEPGGHFRLYLIAMAAVLVLLFWGIAWSNVPQYERDRQEMVDLLQSILDGRPLESSLPKTEGRLAKLGFDSDTSPSDVVLLVLLLSQPAAVITAILLPDLIPAPRLTLSAIFIPVDAAILWSLVRTNRSEETSDLDGE